MKFLYILLFGIYCTLTSKAQVNVFSISNVCQKSFDSTNKLLYGPVCNNDSLSIFKLNLESKYFVYYINNFKISEFIVDSFLFTKNNETGKELVLHMRNYRFDRCMAFIYLNNDFKERVTLGLPTSNGYLDKTFFIKDVKFINK